jgi:hypothetical protein
MRRDSPRIDEVTPLSYSRMTSERYDRTYDIFCREWRRSWYRYAEDVEFLYRKRDRYHREWGTDGYAREGISLDICRAPYARGSPSQGHRSPHLSPRDHVLPRTRSHGRDDLCRPTDHADHRRDDDYCTSLDQVAHRGEQLPQGQYHPPDSESHSSITHHKRISDDGERTEMAGSSATLAPDHRAHLSQLSDRGGDVDFSSPRLLWS